MQPFISQQALLELLQESGLDQTLQLQEGEEFLVETAYLEHWNQDPATEWQMNCMADDAEAAAAPDGTPLFKGDPLNI